MMQFALQFPNVAEEPLGPCRHKAPGSITPSKTTPLITPDQTYYMNYT